MDLMKFKFKKIPGSTTVSQFKEKFKELLTDDFEIESIVREGAAVRVFKGRFQGNSVCIKQYKCDSNSDKFQTLLAEEAKIICSLKNDRVVALHAISLSRICLIMEYTEFVFDNEEGTDAVNNLRQLIEKVEVDTNMQLDFALQVASAMDYLHSKNVIHCDLKATNILTSEKDGKPFCKIGDFDISRLNLVTLYTATTSNRANVNHAKGTLPFMAPEIFTGSNKPEKPQDVYAYSMILYELAEPTISFHWEKEVRYSSIKLKNLF